MTVPRRWPNNAEQYRTETIRLARMSKERIRIVKRNVGNATIALALTELETALTEIELNMVKAKGE